MKSGVCSKCGESEVYADLNASHGISVNRLAFPPVNTILLVCAECGYLEFYIENEKDLAKVKREFQRVEN